MFPNAGDVLDSLQPGEADILHAVDKLDKSKPDVVEHADKADSDADHAADHAAPDVPVDDADEVMPDRAALDSQLVEPPDEHQQ